MHNSTTQAPAVVWNGGTLMLDKPRVMGIVNVTPDSFSDGGLYLDPQAAVANAQRLVAEGAAIIDIGGESTRPGASAVSADEELHRVMPVLERVVSEIQVPVSVDTSKPEVIAAAASAGVAMINDVRALQAPGALEAAAAADCAVCLMHMQGEPRNMQEAPHYGDVMKEVCEFLEARTNACVDAGIPPDHLVIDPGFGFGKTLAHTLTLLRHLPDLLDLGFPVLVGVSRKSAIARISGAEDRDRLAGSLAAAVLASWFGALIIRAHDVRASVEALAVVHAVQHAPRASYD